MPSHVQSFLQIAAAVGAIGLVLDAEPARADWQALGVKDGIELYQRDVPGRDLPEFRGVGVIEASIDRILAVLEEVERHAEWMHECRSARLLAREGDSVSYVYNRTRGTWPVSDRDVVLRSERIVVVPGREIHVVFRSVLHAAQGRVPGVVRMPIMSGHYKLRAVPPAATRVEYQVSADPGGRLPAMLARAATREMPLRTLQNLRRQVSRVLDR